MNSPPKDLTVEREDVLFFSVISYHEMWLCEDPPELLGLHILWVTRDGFQYLIEKRKCFKKYLHYFCS